LALPLFSVYLGLDIDPADHMPNCTYWCHPHTDIEGLYRDAYEGRIPDELPIFLTSATTKDPGNSHAAPNGHSTLELMCIVPQSTFWPSGDGYSQSPDYVALKERLTES
jgi:all-trans-retinol 13,14-reductase